MPGKIEDDYKLTDDRLFSGLSECFSDLVAETMTILQDNIEIVEWYCCMYWGPGSEVTDCLTEFILGERQPKEIDFNADNDCRSAPWNPNGCNNDPQLKACEDVTDGEPHIHFCDGFMSEMEELFCEMDSRCAPWAIYLMIDTIMHELIHHCSAEDLHEYQFAPLPLVDVDLFCWPVDDISASIADALDDLGLLGPMKCLDGVDLCELCEEAPSVNCTLGPGVCEPGDTF